MEKPLSSSTLVFLFFPNYFVFPFYWFLLLFLSSSFSLLLLSFPWLYLFFLRMSWQTLIALSSRLHLHFFGLSDFACSPADQSSFPQKGICSFQGLALEIPNFPFQRLWASAFQYGHNPKPALQVTQEVESRGQHQKLSPPGHPIHTAFHQK